LELDCERGRELRSGGDGNWKVKEKRKGNGTTPWDDGNQEKTERFLQCYITLCNLVGKTP